VTDGIGIDKFCGQPTTDSVHILSLPRVVRLGPNDSVEPGEWVLDDTNAAQLLVRANGGKMQPLIYPSGVDRNADYNGKKILVMRAGGFGDLMLLAPVLREMKRLWPTAHLIVSCFAEYAQVLHGLTYVDEVINYPVPHGLLAECEACIFYEKTIEDNPRAQEIHMTDVFAEVAGIADFENKKPDYRIMPREKAWASLVYPREKATPRIGVQYGASSYARTFRPDLTQEVLKPLHDRGWEIFLFGKKGEVQMKGEAERIKNLSAAGLTFRQSCAVLDTCDVVLAPDSALVHVSAALDIPCVALYGPFPSALRTKYSPSVYAINGKGKCAPCFHHAYMDKHFPEDGPCFKEGHCTVLSGIPTGLISTKLQMQARRQPDELPETDGVIPFRP
jgi:ADP-heptose:LPS heptosyltransferase